MAPVTETVYCVLVASGTAGVNTTTFNDGDGGDCKGGPSGPPNLAVPATATPPVLSVTTDATVSPEIGSVNVTWTAAVGATCVAAFAGTIDFTAGGDTSEVRKWLV